MEESEINLPPIPEEPKGLLLLEDAQDYLHQAGKWGKFLGILGFICSAFIVLAGLFFGAFISLLSRFQPTHMPATFGGILGFCYVLLGVFYFLASWYLYQFGVRIKNGINYKSPVEVSAGLEKLKSFFKLSGITMIVILSLYALFIIVMIVAAVIGFSMVRPG